MVEETRCHRAAASGMMRGVYRNAKCGSRGDRAELFVMAAGESLEDVFPDWVQRSQLDQNGYQPFNLNLPLRIPRRENNVAAYRLDPPLSEFGRFSTKLVARELRRRDAGVRRIYTSPALACVQTAAEIHAVFKFCGGYCRSSCFREASLCVEPGVSGTPAKLSSCLDTEQFSALDIDVELSYEPLNPAIAVDESLEAVYARVADVFRRLVTTAENCCNGSLFVSDRRGIDALLCAAQQLEAAPLSDNKLRTALPGSCVVALSRGDYSLAAAFSVTDAFPRFSFLNISTTPDFDLVTRFGHLSPLD